MSERDMAELLDLVEQHLGASWSQIVEWLRENNSLDDIEAKLHAHDIEGVIAELDVAAKKFAEAVHGGYIEAGQQQAEWLASETDVLVRFDVANDRATRWAKQNAANMVSSVTQDTRDTVRTIVADGVENGTNPRVVARTIRDSIGLTPDRADAVDSYRRALENQQYADALGRALSDGRSDRTIAAAQRDGRALTQGQIDDAVERYRQNQIDSRATAIARTEGLRAAHAGTYEALKQAVDDGHVDADALTRQWHHTSGGKNPRPEHREMNGQTRGLDEPFMSGSGAELMYPGDPDADPSETVNCRCAVSTRLSV